MHIKTVLLAMATALALSPIATLAQEQGGAPSAEPSATTQLQSVIRDYRDTSQQLQAILKKTIKANPDLAATREQFQSQVKAAMSAAGYDVDSARAQMQELGQKLKNASDLDEATRKQLRQELAGHLQAMLKAQQAALQQPEIQAARSELHRKTLAAMRAHSDRADKLVNHMKQLQDQWAEILKSRQELAPASDESGQ